jgi:hypothetical protein
VAINEDNRPLAGVDVEAIDLTDRTVAAVVETNRAGEALFTGLTGPVFFRPRVRRTSVTVGNREYTGDIEVQIVGMSTGGLCYDAVLDPDGGGTHTTLGAALTSAIAASGNHYTILVCSDVSMSATATLGAIDKTIFIVGLTPSSLQNVIASTGADRFAGPTITGPTGDAMITHGSNKDGTDRGLVFTDVGLAPDDGEAILHVDVGSEMDFIEFRHCYFGVKASGGGYLVTNGLDVLRALGNIAITVEDCGGSLSGFWETNATPPDGLFATDNKLTMTAWWTDSNAADFTFVQGGYYRITNAQVISAHGNFDRWHFKNVIVRSACSGAAFRHAAADTNHSGVTFETITFIAGANDTDFGDFQGPAANPQDNLYIHGVHGIVESGVTPSGTFLTVDSDITNPYVADIWAPDWPTVYSGPPIPMAEAIAVVAKTGAYTMTSADGLVVADASGGAFTVTLPTAVGLAGRVYRVKKIDSSSNAVTIDGAGSETIDDATTATIATQYEAITVISDGTEWWVL